MATTLVPAFFDVEGIFRTWLNTLTGSTGLVGTGRPLAVGVHLRRLRSPARGCYAILTTVGTPVALDEEGTIGAARISASIYSATSKENAALAAVAYANTLRTISITRPVVGSARLLTADAITGPLYVPDIDEERYLVDCDLYLTSL